jgi:hypothetical protein
MSNMADVKEVAKTHRPLKATTEELVARFDKEVHIDPKTGVGTFNEGAYIKTLDVALPATLTEKYPGLVEDLPVILGSVQDHMAVVTAAAGLAFGRKSQDFLVKHKDFTRTEADLPTIGKDAIEYVYDKERQVPSRNPDGTTGQKTAYGMLRVGYRLYASEAVGELKKAKQELSASGAGVFGG